MAFDKVGKQLPKFPQVSSMQRTTAVLPLRPLFSRLLSKHPFRFTALNMYFLTDFLLVAVVAPNGTLFSLCPWHFLLYSTTRGAFCIYWGCTCKLLSVAVISFITESLFLTSHCHNLYVSGNSARQNLPWLAEKEVFSTSSGYLPLKVTILIPLTG